MVTALGLPCGVPGGPNTKVGPRPNQAGQRGAAMTDTEFIQITHRELPFSTFDSDNHLYETQDALTKFLPDEYQGIVRYVDIGGRTKLALNDKISDYIPNPTFNRVAVPGGAGMDITQGGEGFNRPGAGARFGKMVAMHSLDAF